MSKFDDAQVTGRYIADLVRRRALAAIATHDDKLTGAYGKLAASIRKDLLKAGYTTKQVKTLLSRHLAGTLNERVKIVEEAIHASAREGRKLDKETYEAVFGDAITGGVADGLRPTFATDAVAKRAASARIRGKVAVDGLSLSKRFHKNDAETVRNMGAALESSIRAGESVTRTAERLLDEGEPIVRLPKYVQELSEAAGAGKNEYQKAVRAWRSQVAHLGQGAAREAGEFTIRSATQQLVRDLANAKPAEISKAVDRWVLDKARYQARIVARNEAVEAFRDSSLQSWEGQEWVVAVKWSLSGDHPRSDICDVVAGQDLYGLGPGNYPKDNVPQRHPSCLCTISAVSDPLHFERELAKAKGQDEPAKPWVSGEIVTGNDWLRAQPLDVRKAVAGPTRAAMVTTGRNVMDSAGAFKPVYELLGQPKPIRHLGPSTAARPLLLTDRSSMVQPFPELKASRETRVAIPRAKPARRAAPRPRPSPSVRLVQAEPAAPVGMSYGKPAPEAAALRAEFDRFHDQAIDSMERVPGRYVGELPAGMSEWARSVRDQVAERLGVTPTRPITNMRAMPLDEINSLGVMDYDGQLGLKIGDKHLADQMFETIVHETIHTAGGAANGAYQGTALVFEEASTEELTRQFLGAEWRATPGAKLDLSDVSKAVADWKDFPADFASVGTYDTFRSRLMSVVSGANGTDAKATAVKVRKAMARWKQRAYATHVEAEKAFIDALEPATPNHRAFYEKTLLVSEDEWSNFVVPWRPD